MSAHRSLVLLALAACSSPAVDTADAGLDGAAGDGAPGTDAAPGVLVLPPVNAGLDYQLGGAYPPPAGVGIVSRDRTDAPAPGVYNICYLNGFQVQPGEDAMWDAAGLILKDANGRPVIDPDWNEALIDVSTPAKRAAVAAIVGRWIADCKGAGFDAIEIDNLDSFTRSGGRLTEAHAVAAMRLFADAAHGHGMPIAQKNSAEIVGRKAEMGTDFVVAEECNRFTECDVYTGAYGDHVLVIEYRRQDFTTGCARWGNQLSIVLRDRNLVTPAQAGVYVFDKC